MDRFRCRYDAQTGKYTIFDVPIFGVVKKGEHPTMKKGVTEEWLKAAVATSKVRIQEDGYAYPTKILHQMPGVERDSAGFFRLTNVRPHSYKGTILPTLFADLYGVHESVYQLIMDGRLPYRSVEIWRPNGDPEIDALSLLSTSTPFWRQKVLTAETIHLENPPEPSDPVAVESGATRAMYECGGRVAALFHDLQEVERMKGIVRFVAGAVCVVTETGAQFSYEDGKVTDGVFITEQEGETIEVELQEGVESPAAPDMSQFGALLESIESRLGALETSEPVTPAKPDPAPAPKADPATAAQFAALQGKIENLERGRERDDGVAAAKKKLAAAGFTELSDRVEEQIEQYADNPDALAIFVDTFIENASPEPPATFEELLDTQPELPKEAADLCRAHPEKTDQIRELAAEFAALRQSGMRADNMGVYIARELGLSPEAA